MTEKSALPFVAQLILSVPGHTDTATITVTLLPDEEVAVDGHRKRLADCTLRELRTFANTLEAEVWQTYDEITLLNMQSQQDVAITAAVLDKSGKIAETLDDWTASIVVLPAAKKPADQAAGDAAAKAEKPRRATAPETGAKGSATAKPRTEKAATAATRDIEPKTVEEAGTPPPPKKEPAPEKEPAPKAEGEAKGKPADLEEVAAAIAFPPPVKQEDKEKARPKPSERPPTPAIIEPSEARVRVAGKRLTPSQAASTAVDIFLDEPPLRAMQAHALSSLDREVAGVMVGPRPEKQPDGRYIVRVIDSIAAKYTVMQGASVTYTADSWRYLNDTLSERYPDETAVMVGWYHTHPGFGIFLSNMDLFIHQNFFTQIWHLAYVLDPRAKTSGFFCWSRDKTRVNRYEFAWPDWTDGSW